MTNFRQQHTDLQEVMVTLAPGSNRGEGKENSFEHASCLDRHFLMAFDSMEAIE